MTSHPAPGVVRAFVVTVPATDAEVAADVLWGLGVGAVEERIGAGGAVELWTHVGDADDIVADARRSMHTGWTVRTVEIDADAVGATWRDYAEPVWVTDGLVIVPSWCDAAATGDALAVRIDPGAAFGLGDHPTTQLTLRAMIALWPSLPASARVLDVGSGSGVLSVVAARLGAAHVVALDHSSAAVEATQRNATGNAVDDRIAPSDDQLESLDEPFDLVVANILAPALVELAPQLTRLTSADGRLVISGVLADRHDHVLAALTPMRVLDTSIADGWAVVVLGH